jgi:hypothetical protein
LHVSRDPKNHHDSSFHARLSDVRMTWGTVAWCVGAATQVAQGSVGQKALNCRALPLRIAAVLLLLGCSGDPTGADAGEGGVECCPITENPIPGACVELGGAVTLRNGFCVTICGVANDVVRTIDAKGCPTLVARTCPDADPDFCLTDATRTSDAMLDHAAGDGGSDAVQSGDAMPDRALADGGSNVNACYAPSDCPSDQTCCVMLDANGSGVVSCQPSALCVPDDSTWLACAMDADCPASLPTCTQISTTPQGRPFSICR